MREICETHTPEEFARLAVQEKQRQVDKFKSVTLQKIRKGLLKNSVHSKVKIWNIGSATLGKAGGLEVLEKLRMVYRKEGGWHVSYFVYKGRTLNGYDWFHHYTVESKPHFYKGQREWAIRKMRRWYWPKVVGVLALTPLILLKRVFWTWPGLAMLQWSSRRRTTIPYEYI